MEAGGVVMKMFVLEGAAAGWSFPKPKGKLLHQLERATAAGGPSSSCAWHIYAKMHPRSPEREREGGRGDIESQYSHCTREQQHVKPPIQSGFVMQRTKNMGTGGVDVDINVVWYWCHPRKKKLYDLPAVMVMVGTRCWKLFTFSCISWARKWDNPMHLWSVQSLSWKDNRTL